MSWDQLAAAVRARRTELGLKQVDVAAAGRISVDVIRNIEHRRRTPKRVNPRTARAIEEALKWEPGSFEETLAGGNPRPILANSPRTKKPPREQTTARDNSAAETRPDSLPTAAPAAEAPTQLDTRDRFALARQILTMRSVLSEHQRSLSPDAREALVTEMTNSAREAEEAIARIMPWLNEDERGEAIQILVELREPLA
jgi:hypothetical protein